MNRLPLIGALLVGCLVPLKCSGHGNPITVNVTDGRLTISNGLELSAGFVSFAYDYHEDAYLDIAPGNTQGSTLPGFDVSGMEVNSELFLEIVSRPDFTDPATPIRWLWFWDKETQETAVAPEDPFLRIASQRGFGDVRVTQFASMTASMSVKALEPRASDIGTHQHPFIYLLDDAPTANYGAYGVFARLTSPNYEASEPFLIALNHSLSSDEYADAARQINASAALPGDYDRNDTVDGSDFLVWQRTLGSTADLAGDGSLNGVVDATDLEIWKENFGRAWASAAAMPLAGAVPEPASAAILACAGIVLRCCGVTVPRAKRERTAQPRCSAKRATIASPIVSAEVAAGDGALSTLTTLPCASMRKSSTSAPSGRSACARTPAGAGIR